MTGPNPTSARAWKRSSSPDEVAALDRLVADGGWDGPIVVSMPRTGSTLLGTIFLLLRDADGNHVFERYIHEPVAPVFWEDAPISSIGDLTGGALRPTDIIQESAYQFTSREIGHWFLSHARRPVSFVMRHPQLAWPSRWRIMLREWLFSNPDDPDAERLQAALDRNDFSEIGDVLTTRVSQPGNGMYSFMSLVDLCDEEGIDFMIVDNARFRADPDGLLEEMCRRWGLDYEDSMTTWETLDVAKPRVVMSPLAAGPEYDWYYARTLGSTGGIIRTDREPVPLERFPDELRGTRDDHLTIDQAVAWYEGLLARPETL